MAAGGEPHDADALWVDAVALGIGANVTDGALHVMKLDREVVAFAAEPIVEHKGADAEAVEELGRLHAFMIRGQTAVTTAGAYHEGCAIGFVLGHLPDVQPRLVRGFGAVSVWSAVWPKGCFGHLCGDGLQGKGGGEEEQWLHGERCCR